MTISPSNDQATFVEFYDPANRLMAAGELINGHVQFTAEVFMEISYCKIAGLEWKSAEQDPPLQIRKGQVWSMRMSLPQDVLDALQKNWERGNGMRDEQ